MTNNHNVVDLNKRAGAGSKSNTSSEKATNARTLPAPLLKVRDKSIAQLKVLLRKLFDNADDALFELADKAGTNGEQAKYFDAMRELRLQRKQIALLMLQSVVRSFNQVGHFKVSGTHADDSGSSLESLSLVQNDELEERVAIEGMISKTRNSIGQALDHYELRIASLLPSVELDSAHTPASPEVLVNGFVGGCKDLEVDIAAKLVVFKLFEKYVLSDAATVYQQANELLVQDGVMPDLQQLKRTSTAQTKRPSSSFETVDQSSHTVLDGETGEVIEEGGLFQDLRDLLKTNYSGSAHGEVNSGRGGVPGTGMGVPVTQVEISRDQLLSVLSGVQHQLDSAHAYSVDSGVMNFRELLADGAVTSEGEQATFNQVDNDVINLISMLFEFILDDRQLQPTMKALIARLQIPMLKVAMLDRNFFNKGGHPARKLLNEIAAAAIGWNEKPNGQRDPLKEKVEYIVQHLLDDFENDLTLFSDLLSEFTRFLDIESRRGQLVEQRTRDAEEGRARNEVSKTFVQQTIQSAVAEKDVPEVALTLLEQGWGQYMSLTYLKHGEESAEWKNAVRVANDLIWSVCPDHGTDDARTTLLKMIPVLLKKIRFGLSEVSFDPFKSNQLLKSLEGLHVDALQQLAAAPAPVSEPDLPEFVSEEPLAKRQKPDDNSAILPEVALLEKDDESVQEAQLASQQDDVFDATAFLEETSSFIEDAALTEAVATQESAEPPAQAPSLAEPAIEALSEQVSSADILPQETSAAEAHVQSNLTTESQTNAREVKVEDATVEEVSSDEANSGETSTDEISADELNADEGKTQIVDDAASQQILDSLRVGSWLETRHEDKTVRCKLAAIIRVTGKYIFVDRSGIKISEKTKDELLGMIKFGEISMLNDGLLFDRALESVIGNLRNNRQD